MRRKDRGKGLLAAALALLASCASPPEYLSPSGRRMIRFAGYDWEVKRSAGRVGPGGNFFSDSARSVFVDEAGALRLRLREEGGKWYAAELGLARSLGYGTYRLELGSRVDELDPNVVVGLFTWSDDPAFANRELDIEFARWGDPRAPSSAQYVVQPAGPDSVFSFVAAQGGDCASLELAWGPGKASFDGRRGSAVEGLSFEALPPLAAGGGIASWFYEGPKLPPAGGEHFRINLYLFQGRPPIDGREVELVVSGFSFERAKRGRPE